MRVYYPQGVITHVCCPRQVCVEKYYTPEQQKAMEKKKKEEEERKARERGDNARERALNDMMGGVLEIKKEDELKKVGGYLCCLQVVNKPHTIFIDMDKIAKLRI